MNIWIKGLRLLSLGILAIFGTSFANEMINQFIISGAALFYNVPAYLFISLSQFIFFGFLTVLCWLGFVKILRTLL
jgi:hypothetical protein